MHPPEKEGTLVISPVIGTHIWKALQLVRAFFWRIGISPVVGTCTSESPLLRQELKSSGLRQPSSFPSSPYFCLVAWVNIFLSTAPPLLGINHTRPHPGYLNSSCWSPPMACPWFVCIHWALGLGRPFSFHFIALPLAPRTL